jgi:gas vesicle protein
MEALMQKLIGFLSGAIMGALVGATLTLLLTPESGKDLQAQLRERIQMIQAEVKKAAAGRRAELEQQLATLRAPRKTD